MNAELDLALERRIGKRSAAVIEKHLGITTSVGARSAAWPPASITCNMARSATTVFPEPTSPCSSRFMGAACASSAARVLPTAAWPAVSVKGRSWSKAARRPSVTGRRAVASSAASWARRLASADCSTRASWYRNRSRARFQSAAISGAWMSRYASATGRKPSLAATVGGSGSGSAPRSTVSSRVPITFWILQLGSLAVAGYTGMGIAASFAGSPVPCTKGSSSRSWKSGLVRPSWPLKLVTFPENSARRPCRSSAFAL